jgi:flagellar protein FliS
VSYGKYVYEYKKNAVNGASPLQLVIMLYDGALRFMEAGKHAMAKRDIYNQNLNLQKAQNIVTELISTLNVEVGGEVAKNLLSLYAFCFTQLVEANVYDRQNQIDAAMRVMSGLRDSWVKLESIQHTEQETPAIAQAA